MSLSPGTRLGSYEVTALIGSGGMGEVYKATDTRLDRTVAIKVLLAHVADDPDLRQRFECRWRALVGGTGACRQSSRVPAAFPRRFSIRPGSST